MSEDTGHVGRLIEASKGLARGAMAGWDASHDFAHVERVVALARRIVRLSEGTISYDLDLVTLAAILHDVNDRKYVKKTADLHPLDTIRQGLLRHGACEAVASKVSDIVENVSYTNEKKRPDHVQAVLQRLPELGVVQDADRLDAMGAVGIGRCFAFCGARSQRGEPVSMDDAIEHFQDKLDHLELMMKTGPGKAMAAERTRRLKEFRGWWDDEQREAKGDADYL